MFATGLNYSLWLNGRKMDGQGRGERQTADRKTASGRIGIRVKVPADVKFRGR